MNSGPERAKMDPAAQDEINSRIVPEIVRRMVQAADPLRIILFGSAARGDTGPDSDLDFLVVILDGTAHGSAWDACYGATRGFRIPVDIVVATVSTLAADCDDPFLVYMPALAEGRELYRATVIPDPVPVPRRPRHLDWLEKGQDFCHMASLDLPGLGRFEVQCLDALRGAELALKAVCRFRGTLFPRHSDLAALMALLGRGGMKIPLSVEGARALSRYAKLEWAPTLGRPIRKREWKKAVRMAEAVVRWAKAQIASGETV